MLSLHGAMGIQRPKGVCECHNGMTASVRVDGKVTVPITVRNGLRQSWTLAPMLFNLYFSAVVASWRSSCPDAGISFHYKVGKKLVGD